MRAAPSFASILLVAALLLPTFALAQSDAELRETIRQALLSDPRSQGMSEEAIDAMVSLLLDGARDEGVTSEDITWRPSPELAQTVGEETSCALTSRFLCTLNRAFGFDGSATLIPILLGATSMLLIVFFGYELERHYMRARTQKGMGATGVPPTPPLA